jgi:hypothetical protein
MIPNIIKDAKITAKDAVGSIKKKIKYYDANFYTEREVEIDAYIARRAELTFERFVILLEDCYIHHRLMEVFVNRFTRDATCRGAMWEEIKCCVAELRRCGVRPYHTLWNQLEEALSRNATFVMDYMDGIQLDEHKYPQIKELELTKGDQFVAKLLGSDKGLQRMYKSLCSLRTPDSPDEEIYAAPIGASYTIWLQAVTGWTDPVSILKDCFPAEHFSQVTSGAKRVRPVAKVKRSTRKTSRK